MVDGVSSPLPFLVDTKVGLSGTLTSFNFTGILFTGVPCILSASDSETKTFPHHHLLSWKSKLYYTWANASAQIYHTATVTQPRTTCHFFDTH